MPSLEEIREWLRGKRVNGLPDRKGKWDLPGDGVKRRKGVDIGKMEDATEAMRKFGNAAMRAKYKINADGDDAVLLFGKHSGKRVSALAKGYPDYLRWLLQQDFPEDLVEIVKYRLQKRYAPGSIRFEAFTGTGKPPEHFNARCKVVTEDDLEEDEKE